MRLLLDLVGTCSGPGAALRCLADMEVATMPHLLQEDVALAWAPASLQVSATTGLAVAWRDPIILSYLPTSLVPIHFGVEVEAGSRAVATRVVGRVEARLLRPTWRAAGDQVSRVAPPAARWRWRAGGGTRCTGRPSPGWLGRPS